MTATNWTNITTIQQIVDIPNTFTQGNFWGFMVFLVVIVSFLSLMYAGWEVAVLVSLFIGLVISILLNYLSVMSGIWIGVYVAGLILAFIVLTATNKRND